MIELASESSFAEGVHSWDTHDLRHRLQNSRALRRRRGLSARMQASLDMAIPIMTAEVESRNEPISWRAYPTELRFGARFETEDWSIGHLAPESERGLKRSMRSTEPAPVSAADMLSLIEASIAAQVNGRADA